MDRKLLQVGQPTEISLQAQNTDVSVAQDDSHVMLKLINLSHLNCQRSQKTFMSPPQAIQDITRNRDIDPEEIVSLIFERIDVKGEGKE